MDDTAEWSWAGEDGIEHDLTEEELSFALSSEAIPAYTLVWRKGWAEWLPAMQVAELRWALPAGRADTPRKPTLSEDGSRSAPPLAAYGTLRFRSEEIAAGRISPQFETALALSPTQPPTTSLRPLAPYVEDNDEPTVQLESEDLEGDVSVADALTRARTRLRAGASGPPPGAPQTTAPPAALKPGTELPDSIRVPGPPRLPNLSAVPRHSPPRRNRFPLPWVIGGGIAVVLLSLGVWLSMRSSEPPPARVTPTEVPTPARQAEPLAPLTCRQLHAPTQLGEFAKPELKPAFSIVPDSTEIAIGYGQTSRYAMGLKLNPKNFQLKKVYSAFDNSPVLSVVPLIRGNEVEFFTERASSTLKTSRFIDGDPPFAVGVSQEHLSRRIDRKHTQLWATSWESFTVPEVITLTDKTHVLALRGGGERGSIVLGKLSSRGAPIDDLLTVSLPTTRVGEPVFTTDQQFVYLGAEGGPDASKGQLLLGHAELPSLPTHLQLVELDNPIFDPSIAAIPGLGVAAQWTEGTPGAQHVMLVMFDTKLERHGTPFRVSGPDLDAHHSSLFATRSPTGNTLLSLYMVRDDQNHELWGATYECK